MINRLFNFNISLVGLIIAFISLNINAQSNKPVIAIGEITSAIQEFNTLSIQLSLENAFTKTNKFTIMERTRLQYLLAERGLSASGITDGNASLGGFSGVDYLVYGSVSNITIERKNLLIVLSCSARLSMNIRIVDVNTGEIRLSENLTIDKTVGTSPSDGDPCAGISLASINVLGENASDGIANKMTMSIFPIKVAKVSNNGEIYLNYGEGTISKEDILSIKVIGEGFVDPDSGELLGAEEETTAVIVVSDVRQNFSIGHIVASNNSINIGDTAYKLQSSGSIKRKINSCISAEKKRIRSCSKNLSSKRCQKDENRVNKFCHSLMNL